MFGQIPASLYNSTDLTVLRLDDTTEQTDSWNHPFRYGRPNPGTKYLDEKTLTDAPLVEPNQGFTGSISTLIGRFKDLRWLLLNNNPISGTM